MFLMSLILLLSFGNKIIDLMSFNLLTALMALERSFIVPSFNLVLRSICSKAISGLVPCTAQLI